MSSHFASETVRWESVSQLAAQPSLPGPNDRVAVLVHGAFADSASWNRIISWMLSGELSLPDLAELTEVCESDGVESPFTYQMAEPGRQRWGQFSVAPRRLI